MTPSPTLDIEYHNRFCHLEIMTDISSAWICIGRVEKANGKLTVPDYQEFEVGIKVNGMEVWK